MKSADRLVLEAWGTRIRNARSKQGLSQAEAAARCRMSQSTLSKIEQGDYRLHPEVVLRICQGLELNPDIDFAWPPAIVEIARMRTAAA